MDRVVLGGKLFAPKSSQMDRKVPGGNHGYNLDVTGRFRFDSLLEWHLEKERYDLHYSVGYCSF